MAECAFDFVLPYSAHAGEQNLESPCLVNIIIIQTVVLRLSDAKMWQYHDGVKVLHNCVQ